MNNINAVVTQFSLDSRSDEGSMATITVHRVFKAESHRSPSPDDVPADVRTALLKWLGVTASDDPQRQYENLRKQFDREKQELLAKIAPECLNCKQTEFSVVHQDRHGKGYHPFNPPNPTPDLADPNLWGEPRIPSTGM